ncbi:CaiB/BaiF CoA transferase family protein [Tepidiforma thermophila]|uniref:Benzylsuccinate CoA-transferase BbsE subunit n=1 Tax=Tepidiforma thermophila (strain KCTC 52669 / CGMCC 1.13589 / G233) TaxID=2761530 RepID=A0A2A9HIX0_TEPT2|nr:CoA transferase [Tepidiforma thermophila]PFG74789.1 benzylsuccinate CoA-transferase BbsE subunit [Tepidiforma thermophila]
MPDRALDGVRVIEFADETAAYCGRLLADLGAEVIKVEPPGGGRLRRARPFVKGHEGDPNASLAFWVHNTSKKSVVLDLETDEGRTLARKLALTADIVLEDYPVGYLAERGLGFNSLHAEKPALVYTSVTGFGQDGPHAHWAYSDIVGQAMGGIMTLAGEPTDPPNMIYGRQADISASIQAAQGTLMALLYAEATGEGQQVDVSAQEALSMAQETAMQTWDFQKRNRTRTGELGMLPIPLPATGVAKCRDGYVSLYILAPAGKDLPALVDWMREKGMQGPLDDEPYRTIVNQLNMAWLTQLMSNLAAAGEILQHLPVITKTILDFFATMSAREAYEEGQRRQLLIGIVSTPKDIAENAQLRARDWFVRIESPLGGTIEFPGPPYRLSETPAVISRPPRLGEHTDDILASLR